MSKGIGVKPRDMAALLTATAGTHARIQQGIQERALEHERYRHERDAMLTAEQHVTRPK